MSITHTDEAISTVTILQPYKKEKDNTMSKEDMKALWNNVNVADDAVNTAQAALDEAISKRSDALKEIAENCGKGPFKVNGQQVTIRSRGKKDGSDPTYFLVGKGKSDVIDLD